MEGRKLASEYSGWYAWGHYLLSHSTGDNDLASAPKCRIVERSRIFACLGLACFGAACSSGQGDGGFPFAGSCVLTAAVMSGGASSYSASAEFGSPLTPPPFCQNGTAAGSCCLYTGGGPDGGAVASPMVSAGMLTAVDHLTPIATMQFDVGTNAYPLVAQANPWGAGDTLSWSGDGEVAGTFSGSVTAPSALQGLNPNPGAQAVPIQRDADLTIFWAPDAVTSGAKMRVDLSEGYPVQFSTLIVCEADDSAGTVVVPMSLLQQLTTNGTGYLLYQRINQSTTDGHNVSVNLVAESTAYAAATFK